MGLKVHIFFHRATGADEMCNFYMMYWYDPAEGVSTDACAFYSFQSSDYPPETDEPLPAEKKMEMKREMNGELTSDVQFIRP